MESGQSPLHAVLEKEVYQLMDESNLRKNGRVLRRLSHKKVLRLSDRSENHRDHPVQRTGDRECCAGDNSALGQHHDEGGGRKREGHYARHLHLAPREARLP